MAAWVNFCVSESKPPKNLNHQYITQYRNPYHQMLNQDSHFKPCGFHSGTNCTFHSFIDVYVERATDKELSIDCDITCYNTILCISHFQST